MFFMHFYHSTQEVETDMGFSIRESFSPMFDCTTVLSFIMFRLYTKGNGTGDFSLLLDNLTTPTWSYNILKRLSLRAQFVLYILCVVVSRLRL